MAAASNTGGSCLLYLLFSQIINYINMSENSKYICFLTSVFTKCVHPDYLAETFLSY